MVKEMSQPEEIHLRIVEIMKRFPEGISSGQIKCELGREGIPPEDLRHLARRIRELDRWFIIEKKAIVDPAERGEQVFSDQEWTSQTLRAAVLYQAHGRCQRCGKTIKADGIRLMVERKEPEYCEDVDYRDGWWAVCEDCSVRRKACFVSPMMAGARPRLKGCRMSTSGKLGRHRP
jgi:hypothetical protein